MYNYDTIKQLAKDNGGTVNNYLALSPKNDPFYMGTPSDVARGRWFADLFYSAQNSQGGAAMHLRAVHYFAVSTRGGLRRHDGQPYENTQKNWEYLIESAKSARYLEYVPMSAIVDNKNPDPHVSAFYSPGDPTYQINIPQLDRPHVWLDGFTVSNAQPFHLEVWFEKSTMNNVLLPVCQRYGANLVTFEGEVSITSVCVNLMERIAEADKPVMIFYLSDLDPAGHSMPVAMSRKLEYALYQADRRDLSVGVKPIALTIAQAEHYNLPRTPVKDGEKRGASLVERVGGAVELDALQALYPGELARIVERELKPFYSFEAARAVRAAETRLRDDVYQRVQEVLSRYQPQIDALRAMNEELEQIDIDTSDYAVPTFDPDDYGDRESFLFDSWRDYTDQIAAYKDFKA